MPSPPPAVLARFEPVLTRLSTDPTAGFGEIGLGLTPTGYEERPFSTLLRVAVSRAGEPGPFTHVFAKISKPKAASEGIDMPARVQRDFELTTAIHAFMSRWPDTGTIRPVVCYPDLCALVTEEVVGRTLLNRLESVAGWFPSRARIEALEAELTRTGLWLRRFQEYAPTQGSLDPSTVASYVDIRLQRLVAHEIVTSGYRMRVLDHLAALAGDFEGTDRRDVAIHADFALGNVLLSHAGVVVLDFAMTSRGSWLHDITRLYLQLDMLRVKPRFRPSTIRRLQQALLNGLHPGLTPERPLFRSLMMLHRINNLGTLALRREPLPGRLLSARAIRMHRLALDRELARGGGR